MKQKNQTKKRNNRSGFRIKTNVKAGPQEVIINRMENTVAISPVRRGRLG